MDDMRSESIAALAGALSLAQSEIEGARKDRSNDHLKSKYATLASCWDAAREPLTKNGLSVAQIAIPSEPGTVSIKTLLLHKSGEWLGGILSIPCAQNTPQGYGSAITYARRYAFSAIVGVAPDDDDGNGAQPVSSTPPRPTTTYTATRSETTAKPPVRPQAPAIRSEPLAQPAYTQDPFAESDREEDDALPAAPATLSEAVTEARQTPNRERAAQSDTLTPAQKKMLEALFAAAGVDLPEDLAQWSKQDASDEITSLKARLAAK